MSRTRRGWSFILFCRTLEHVIFVPLPPLADLTRKSLVLFYSFFFAISCSSLSHAPCSIILYSCVQSTTTHYTALYSTRAATALHYTSVYTELVQLYDIRSHPSRHSSEVQPQYTVALNTRTLAWRRPFLLDTLLALCTSVTDIVYA